jgi:hypothetical protein
MPEDDIEIAACKRYASSRLFRSSWVTRAPQGDAYGTQRGSGVSVLTRMTGALTPDEALTLISTANAARMRTSVHHCPPDTHGTKDA